MIMILKRDFSQDWAPLSRITGELAATGPVLAYRFIRIPKDKGEDVGALKFLLLSLELKAILCLQLGPREHQLLPRQNARRYSGAGENES